MPGVEISDECFRKLKAFKMVADVVLKDELKDDSGYMELVMTIGLETMLRDLFPSEGIMPDMFLAMFEENPEFVSGFIAKMLERGELVKERKEKEIRDRWTRYIG